MNFRQILFSETHRKRGIKGGPRLLYPGLYPYFFRRCRRRWGSPPPRGRAGSRRLVGRKASSAGQRCSPLRCSKRIRQRGLFRRLHYATRAAPWPELPPSLPQRFDPAHLPEKNLGRSIKDQEYLLRAVGVCPKPVARLDLEVNNCRVLVSGSQKEGEVDPNPHCRVVLVPGLHQLKLTDLGTNHVFSFRFDQRDCLGQLLSSHFFPAGNGLVLLQTLTVLLSLPLSPAGQLPSLTMTANNELVKG